MFLRQILSILHFCLKFSNGWSNWAEILHSVMAQRILHVWKIWINNFHFLPFFSQKCKISWKSVFPEHSSTPFGPIHFFLMAMLEWMNVGFINSKKTNLHYFNEVLEISIIAWIWASISGGIFVTSGTDNLF